MCGDNNLELEVGLQQNSFLYTFGPQTSPRSQIKLPTPLAPYTALTPLSNNPNIVSSLAANNPNLTMIVLELACTILCTTLSVTYAQAKFASVAIKPVVNEAGEVLAYKANPNATA
jgi:energy-converting hydrogenase Eha subunit F